MGYPGWKVRDAYAPRYRATLMNALGLIPFHHQAQVFAYMDKLDLAKEPTCDISEVPQFDREQLVLWIEGVQHWLIAVPQFVQIDVVKWGDKGTEIVPAFDEYEDPIVEHKYFAVTPSERPRAKVVSISCAFKGGKSQVGGIIPASFGRTPDLRWDIYGLEYDICEPELEYVLEAFLSEDGLNLPKVRYPTGNELKGYLSWKNDPVLGRMHLQLSNGARYVCRSMRKALETKSDPLKGKERDGFSIAEVYQFPSIQSLMSYRQNLAKRRGYYVMPSTPDRPIMDEINARADPENPDTDYATWLGVSEVHRRENPYAWVMEDYFEDLKTFTREEFTVYWEGKSGRWIGAVYPQPKFFDTHTHPELWKDIRQPPTFENFKPPTWYRRLGAADTGTLYGVVSALADDQGNKFFLHCACNYRYVTGQIEQMHDVTVETVCEEVRSFRTAIGGKWPASYADPNSQWKSEFKSNGVPLRKGIKDPELRCEVTRGMAQNGFIWFAPWLRDSPLVTEFEIAKYPPKELSTRRRRRIDANDHLLDPAEHLCGRHPRAQRPNVPDIQNPVRELMRTRKRRPTTYSGDPLTGG